MNGIGFMGRFGGMGSLKTGLQVIPSGVGLIIIAKVADPDVSKSHRVPMFIQFDGSLGRVRPGIISHSPIRGVPVEILSMMHHDAVVDDGNVRAFDEFAFSIPAGPFEDNVVGLPLSGRFGGVFQRWLLSIHGRHHAVGIGLVLITVQNLDFISSENIHAVVAASLALALDFFGCGKFQVELEVTKGIAGADAPRACGFHVTVFQFPVDLVIASGPLAEVGAIKENDGIGGCWGLMAEVLTGSDHRRFGPVGIMYMPFTIGLHGGIGETFGGLARQGEDSAQKRLSCQAFEGVECLVMHGSRFFEWGKGLDWDRWLMNPLTQVRSACCFHWTDKEVQGNV